MRLVRGSAITAWALVVAGAGHAALVGCGDSGEAAGPAPLGNEAAHPGPDGSGDAPDAASSTPPPPPEPPPPPNSVVSVGVFVSAAKGDDAGDGSNVHPVKTLAAAVALAKDKSLPVNACAETYEEAVTLANGVSMYGYLDCADLTAWKRVEARARIVAPTSPAVLGEHLSKPARFAGFDVQAPDMAGPPAAGASAASSYAMILRSSKYLAIEDAMLRAGKGQDGVDGVEPAQGNAEQGKSAAGEPSLAGERQECTNHPQFGWACNFGSPYLAFATRPGAKGGTSQCRVGPNGGAGGTGGAGRIASDGVYVTNGYDATTIAGRPLVANGSTAKGGAAAVGWTPGSSGSDAAAGEPGKSGTTGSGSFTEAGFAPGNGTAGAPGAPGQGGGGGAGTIHWKEQYLGDTRSDAITYQAGTVGTGIGAGGGAGGCGGLPGTPGRGGGASIGLFVVAGEGITIERARIEAGEGGRAGKGTLGTVGTAGHAGGVKTISSESWSGEAGGHGGPGGAAGLSGHGAPGPAIALVFSGPRPQTTEVVLAQGSPGEGAPALERGAQTLPAVSGEAKQEHAF